ncbi:metal ABC transporter permease [Longispora albida]|uniref:metal ABC transporter permease n=1 Tax=Longispora albida TaxID=203523 RepID=UPI0003723399|nr:metal ABC transporter permease [Longispora albida]
MSYLTSDFMIRALIGALLVGVTAPAIGVYLVQRKMALIGDGIGHVALFGVAVGFLFGTSPVLTATLVSALGAIAIELVRERTRTSGDIALAIMFYGGIAGGVVLIYQTSQGTNATLTSYLFGSLLGTTSADLVVMGALSAFVLSVALIGRPWLFAVCQDEEHAKVSGLPVRFLNLLLAVTAAVTVTVAMRAVGLLLVSALMVIPVATAQQFTRSFTATLFTGMAIGVAVSAIGVIVSAEVDTPPGGFIVVVAVVLFAVVATVAGLLRSRKPAPLPEAPEPPDVVLHQVT